MEYDIDKRIPKVLMGGTIGVVSQLGKGSTFYFTLPFLIPGNGKGPPLPGTLPTAFSREHETSTPDHVRTASALNILLIDDKPINQKLFTTNLERMGHNVTSAYNGKKAVELCKSNVLT